MANAKPTTDNEKPIKDSNWSVACLPRLGSRRRQVSCRLSIFHWMV
jgi:hypothetical protein